jgi:hypothetical protein
MKWAKSDQFPVSDVYSSSLVCLGEQEKQGETVDWSARRRALWIFTRGIAFYCRRMFLQASKRAKKSLSSEGAACCTTERPGSGLRGISGSRPSPSEAGGLEYYFALGGIDQDSPVSAVQNYSWIFGRNLFIHGMPLLKFRYHCPGAVLAPLPAVWSLAWKHVNGRPCLPPSNCSNMLLWNS